MLIVLIILAVLKSMKKVIMNPQIEQE